MEIISYTVKQPMNLFNFEFKARSGQLLQQEEKLKCLNPVFLGEDHQIDTYFQVENGRLKLREGNIENALIQYDRENTKGAKASEIILYQHEPNRALKEILSRSLGVKAIVEKKRKIYFIDHIKFHFDQVQGLGDFIEVEAIDKDGSLGASRLKEHCAQYAAFFEIKETDYVSESYSDLILENRAG